MAPTEDPFPVSQLEERVHFVKRNFKDKNRKLPKNFNLKRDCELFELVQYSCTTEKEIREAVLRNKKHNPMECFPFVRLFRRCGSGTDTFHVETTAWEGDYAWEPKRILEEATTPMRENEIQPKSGWLWYKS